MSERGKFALAFTAFFVAIVIIFWGIVRYGGLNVYTPMIVLIAVSLLLFWRVPSDWYKNGLAGMCISVLCTLVVLFPSINTIVLTKGEEAWKRAVGVPHLVSAELITWNNSFLIPLVLATEEAKNKHSEIAQNIEIGRLCAAPKFDARDGVFEESLRCLREKIDVRTWDELDRLTESKWESLRYIVGHMSRDVMNIDVIDVDRIIISNEYYSELLPIQAFRLMMQASMDVRQTYQKTRVGLAYLHGELGKLIELTGWVRKSKMWLSIEGDFGRHYANVRELNDVLQRTYAFNCFVAQALMDRDLTGLPGREEIQKLVIGQEAETAEKRSAKKSSDRASRWPMECLTVPVL